MKKTILITSFLLFILCFVVNVSVFAQPTTNPTLMRISPCYGKVGEPVRVTINVTAWNPNSQDIYYKYFVNMGRYCTPNESSDPDQWKMLQNWTKDTTLQTEPLTFSQEGKNIFIAWATTPSEKPSVFNPSSPDPPDFHPGMIGQYFEVKNILTGQEERATEIQISGDGVRPIVDIIIVDINETGSIEQLYKFWVNKLAYWNAEKNWEKIGDGNWQNSGWGFYYSSTNEATEGIYTCVAWTASDPNQSCVGMAGGTYVFKPRPLPIINIDGDPNDWAQVAPLAIDLLGDIFALNENYPLSCWDILKIKVMNDVNFIYFLLEFDSDSIVGKESAATRIDLFTFGARLVNLYIHPNLPDQSVMSDCSGLVISDRPQVVASGSGAFTEISVERNIIEPCLDDPEGLYSKGFSIQVNTGSPGFGMDTTPWKIYVLR